MTEPKSGNAVVGQAGGPTAVINESLYGIIQEEQKYGHIRRLFGARHGVRGIINEQFYDLNRQPTNILELVAHTPAAALGATRDKPDHDYCERIFKVFRKHDIRYFYYIGGNDSAETAHILNELAVEQGYDLRLFHVPKTIDNDLRVTDHCPGYGSAAKFVAQAMIGDDEDNRSLPGIKIDVVMGRNAGWLTAASVLARRNEGDGPHLVYVPERTFDLERFAADVGRVYEERGRCLVALSEGVHGPDGKSLVESKEKDSHGNVQLSGSGALGDFLAAEVKARLGAKLRVRADTFGYLQRSFAGCVSEVDAEEAREVGRRAAEVALKGKVPHGSIVIRRKTPKKGARSGYEVAYDVAALADVAKETRPLDERHLAGDNDVAPAFLEYVRPLVGKLPKTGRLSDFPIAAPAAG
jgi:6-phosphofructokinase 1